MKISIVWIRRDLRLQDNTALCQALNEGFPVLPVFIFDEKILNDLPQDDARVNFIYQNLFSINKALNSYGSSLKIYKGQPEIIWRKIINEFKVVRVFANRDYEPYALQRDALVNDFLKEQGIPFITHKDQVIFEGDEILKKDGKPYTVFTAYKKIWLDNFHPALAASTDKFNYRSFYKKIFRFPTLAEIGFLSTRIKVKDYNLSQLNNYSVNRDLPWKDATSYLSPHLRFGTVSIRKIIQQLDPRDSTFLSELIWREFFMQILYHFPKVVHENFHSKYDGIKWHNNKQEFELWCEGKTGYPMVDAGMRQLNESGYMHNRVRMVTASFLCKHLLIDWRWGERFFSRKLLDFELSSNNGNWQWAAGTGCDAAPYFRVFNPSIQLEKFDKDLKYVKKWIAEYGTADYPEPMVEHSMARQRAIQVYKEGIEKTVQRT